LALPSLNSAPYGDKFETYFDFRSFINAHRLIKFSLRD
jgi:hypothetical protein